MCNIPKAEEFFEQWCNKKGYVAIDQVEDIEECMIEFAKLHVELALKTSHHNMQLPEEDLEFTLNSYHLTNIK